MTGKERAEKRAEANSLEPLMQIGKDGVTDAVAAQLENIFNTRELMKLKVHLDTCPVSVREVADSLSEKSGAEVIQVIGGVVVLYRYNKELHEPKKTKKKDTVPPSKRQSIKERTKRFRKQNNSSYR